MSGAPTVNVAEQTIDWLFDERFGIGEDWSYRIPTGFTWWADRYAQTVEIVGQQSTPDGQTGYLIAVRTELLTDLDLTDDALAAIGGVAMRCAAMSGPVYDVEARRLDVWSLARVHDANAAWIRDLIGAAATTQLAEARALAPLLAERTGARAAVSGHPQCGMREVPDEMAYAAAALVAAGDRPCAWPESEFAELAAREVPGKPRVHAHGAGFHVTFGFGDGVSECSVRGDQPHPVYGNGLLVLQRFEVPAASESEGIALALSLNAADLTAEPTGHGFGSYVWADGAIHFSGFVSNALHRPGLLANSYLSCAARAAAMAARFAEGQWDAEAYSLDAGVLTRRRGELAASTPALAPPMRGCPMMRARSEGS